jgi:hypothetical protein
VRAGRVGQAVPSQGLRVERVVPPNRARVRSRSLDMTRPENWSAATLCDKLKTAFNLNLPPSTSNTTLVKVYKRLSEADQHDTQAAPLDQADTGVRVESSAQSRDLAVVDILQHDGGESQPPHNTDIDVMRQGLAAVQASLAELHSKQQPAEISGRTNINQSVLPQPLDRIEVVYTRVPVDSLPKVHVVAPKIRTDIHNNKYVNLALLLIPGMDSQSQTQITDRDGTQVVVRAADARLHRNLSIHEFRLAFTLFKNVVFEKEPDRRRELDTYSEHIDQMFLQFGGTHFYTYHKEFARQAEQYASMGQLVDWASRDTTLQLRVFSGLRSASCDLCLNIDHTAGFCPLNRDQLTHTDQLGQSPTARPPAAVRDYPTRPLTPSRSPGAVGVGDKRVDKHGRPRVFYNQSEICNNFNAGGCAFTHSVASRLVHWCSQCMAATHAAPACPRAPTVTPTRK